MMQRDNGHSLHVMPCAPFTSYRFATGRKLPAFGQPVKFLASKQRIRPINFYLNVKEWLGGGGGGKPDEGDSAEDWLSSNAGMEWNCIKTVCNILCKACWVWRNDLHALLPLGWSIESEVVSIMTSWLITEVFPGLLCSDHVMYMERVVLSARYVRIVPKYRICKTGCSAFASGSLSSSTFSFGYKWLDGL